MATQRRDNRRRYSWSDDEIYEDDESHIGSSDEDDDDGGQYKTQKPGGGRGRGKGFKLLDPRAKWLQEWNKIYLWVCVIGLLADPLFFFVFSIGDSCMCLFLDGWLALTVTAIRCLTDGFHVLDMCLQLFMIKRNAIGARAERSGPNAIPYLTSIKGFFLDVYIILPILQVTVWVLLPPLLEKGYITEVMYVLMIAFIIQFPAKIYHSVLLLRRLQRNSGYILGTVWWGIAISMVAYFVIAQASGGFWFTLGIQRSAQCLGEQCGSMDGCTVRLLAAKPPFYYGEANAVKDKARIAWAAKKSARETCLESADKYPYGTLGWTVQLVTNENRAEKLLFPLFWGLMTLSTFGNLDTATHPLQCLLTFVVMTLGIIIATMLIGNYKVFLDVTSLKKHEMHMKMAKIEWWMKSNQLPQELRQRVRDYEWHRWAATHGADESEMIKDLPEGLRRDIRYQLSLDLLKQVPFFQHVDHLVLENICDRVKPLMVTKGEMITRAGDPIQRMLFVVRGHLECTQVIRNGVLSRCMIGPGNFSGDELLSWSTKSPFIERLPPSSSTLVTLETVEALTLEAEDLRYITQHFRYAFLKERVKMSARYYSPGWRTWAAVTIQLGWRRRKARLAVTSRHKPSLSFGDERLKLFTAMLTSPKPSVSDPDKL